MKELLMPLFYDIHAENILILSKKLLTKRQKYFILS